MAEVGCSVLSAIFSYFTNCSFYFGEKGMERAQPEKAESALGYELLVLAIKWFLTHSLLEILPKNAF